MQHVHVCILFSSVRLLFFNYAVVLTVLALIAVCAVIFFADVSTKWVKDLPLAAACAETSIPGLILRINGSIAHVCNSLLPLTHLGAQKRQSTQDQSTTYPSQYLGVSDKQLHVQTHSI